MCVYIYKCPHIYIYLPNRNVVFAVTQTGKAYHDAIKAENPHLSEAEVINAGFIREQARKGEQSAPCMHTWT